MIPKVSPVIDETTFIRLNRDDTFIPDLLSLIIKEGHATEGDFLNTEVIFSDKDRLVREEVLEGVFGTTKDLKAVHLVDLVHSLGDHSTNSVHDNTLRETIAPAVSRNLLKVTSVTVKENNNYKKHVIHPL
jgi:hypothetical protein